MFESIVFAIDEQKRDLVSKAHVLDAIFGMAEFSKSNFFSNRLSRVVGSSRSAVSLNERKMERRIVTPAA